jgi:hypothetical protein
MKQEAIAWNLFEDPGWAVESENPVFHFLRLFWFNTACHIYGSKRIAAVSML